MIHLRVGQADVSGITQKLSSKYFWSIHRDKKVVSGKEEGIMIVTVILIIIVSFLFFAPKMLQPISRRLALGILILTPIIILILAIFKMVTNKIGSKMNSDDVEKNVSDKKPFMKERRSKSLFDVTKDVKNDLLFVPNDYYDPIRSSISSMGSSRSSGRSSSTSSMMRRSSSISHHGHYSLHHYNNFNYDKPIFVITKTLAC
jgi:hypothetical protein